MKRSGSGRDDFEQTEEDGVLLCMIIGEGNDRFLSAVDNEDSDEGVTDR